MKRFRPNLISIEPGIFDSVKAFSFIFYLFALSTFAQENLSGTYQGQFSFGNFSTDLILEIDDQPEQVQVLFSSPEQNAFGIPAREVTRSSDSIVFALQSDYYRYQFKGMLSQEELFMNLSVDNKSFPFVLHREKKSNQTESRSRDIRYRSDELLLYGTVYFPEKPNGKAIYLVTSSGNQDRSATRAEALFFARNGYIAMHIDKRGTGLSDGNWEQSSIPELCADDIRAITYLAETNGMKYGDIGIKGSSQGASKVPFILSELPELSFGILVSCPASTLLESDLNYWKNRHKNQLEPAELMRAENLQNSVFQYIAGNISQKSLRSQLDSTQTKPWISTVWVPDLEAVQTDPKLNYSPLPYLDRLKQPLLVIQGEADEIIPENSLETIRNFTRDNNPKNTYVKLGQADHAMMYKGPSDFPYWSSLHPDYKMTLLDWLKALGSGDK